MKKLTVSIGIPAYNEEENIENLLKAIFKQKIGKYTLQKVIVVCDGSTDKTPAKVKFLSKRFPRIDLHASHQKLGKTSRLNQIYKFNKSDFLITFDADVFLASPYEVNKMVNALAKSKNDLVGAANLTPTKHPDFFSRIMYANNMLWNEIRKDLNGGDHIANLYGSATVLRKEFANTLQYPSSITCDQEYLYLSVKKRGNFKFVKDTQILFNPPSTFIDYKKQGMRFLTERNNISPYFGQEAFLAHHVPLSKKITTALKMILEDPIFTVLAIGLDFWLKILPRDGLDLSNGQWERATSTKLTIL